MALSQTFGKIKLEFIVERSSVWWERERERERESLCYSKALPFKIGEMLRKHFSEMNSHTPTYFSLMLRWAQGTTLHHIILYEPGQVAMWLNWTIDYMMRNTVIILLIRRANSLHSGPRHCTAKASREREKKNRKKWKRHSNGKLMFNANLIHSWGAYGLITWLRANSPTLHVASVPEMLYTHVKRLNNLEPVTSYEKLEVRLKEIIPEFICPQIYFCSTTIDTIPKQLILCNWNTSSRNVLAQPIHRSLIKRKAHVHKSQSTA